MASDKIKRILSDQGPREAKGELSFLARRILQDIGMTPYIWEASLQAYMERNKKIIPTNKKDRSYFRGNLNTQFTHPKMTWRTFVEFLRFLNPVKIRITVELTWPKSGETTLHHVSVHCRPNAQALSVAEKEIALPFKNSPKKSSKANTSIEDDDSSPPEADDSSAYDKLHDK